MNKIVQKLNLYTVQKKILLVSKLSGAALAFLYVIAVKSSPENDLALYGLIAAIATVIMVTDFCLKRFITLPLIKLNKITNKLANLDFSEKCDIVTSDEYSELAANINKMAENLKDALDDLEQINIKLEKDICQKERLLVERKELVDSLSHEMKTPIGIIRAYAESMENNIDPDQFQRNIDVIIDETKRMNKLITTLIDLSALESGVYELKKERFEFVEFVETIFGRLLLDIPDNNYNFEYDLPSKKVFVYSDKRRMEQVVENLLINARKNLEPGGILRLSLKEHEGFIKFSLFNQGKNIPESILSKIWTKFYRTPDAEYEGTGLGLAIVSQILSMQNYGYGVQNEPNGVTFYFYLPVSK